MHEILLVRLTGDHSPGTLRPSAFAGASPPLRLPPALLGLLRRLCCGLSPLLLHHRRDDGDDISELICVEGARATQSKIEYSIAAAHLPSAA